MRSTLLLIAMTSLVLLTFVAGDHAGRTVKGTYSIPTRESRSLLTGAHHRGFVACFPITSTPLDVQRKECGQNRSGKNKNEVSQYRRFFRLGPADTSAGNTYQDQFQPP
ncbi:hypothetical protein H4Q26_001065 [Puccinia striiformis f. sp. tritici PST-130]|nr:hypothetical protein H4Q26_001065 [Puccinia striiformis f. sp. tritici PST-130]